MDAMVYAIWTASDETGSVEINRAPDAKTMALAMRAAKRLAGRGAHFVRRGVDYGYAGDACTAWIEAVRA